jgi:hypothetical protein
MSRAWPSKQRGIGQVGSGRVGPPENLTAVNIGPSRRNMLSYARIAMNF